MQNPNSHTPGPWVASGLSVYTDMPIKHHTSPRDPTHRHVAQASWNDAPDWDDKREEADKMNMPANYREALANATLIAAAPELLSALRWIVTTVSCGMESPESMDYVRPDIEHALMRANMAISRATAI